MESLCPEPLRSELIPLAGSPFQSSCPLRPATASESERNPCCKTTEGRHWRRDGSRENRVARVNGRPIYSYVIARFASFFVIYKSYLTRELNVLPPHTLSRATGEYRDWDHTTAFVHPGSEPHNSAVQRQSLRCEQSTSPTLALLSPRLQPTHSSTHNWGGGCSSAVAPPIGRKSLWRAGVTLRTSTSARAQRGGGASRERIL